MSGHSKWATTKHRKALVDSKKAKAFTQLARAITVAARTGGGDPNFNFALRLAVDKARASNVPKDNIDRAIKRGTGELEGAQIEEKRYEGYGPNGIAFIVDALTDNSNRTVADLKHVFSKNGGNLEGSVSWQFEQRGVIYLVDQAPKANDESFVLDSIEHGIEDIQTADGDLVLLTEPTKLKAAKEWIDQQNLAIENADLEMIPKETIKLSPDEEEKVIKLIDALDEEDDVEHVYHNLELSE